MKYKINRNGKKKIKCCRLDTPSGYPMASKNHKFVVSDMEVKNILVIDEEMISTLISKKVKAKYDKLIKTLTELLISDDETGSCFREALNLIEKFRLEIKNKYRYYLKEKELRTMANKLKTMQQIALQKEIEIKSFVTEEFIGKSR